MKKFSWIFLCCLSCGQSNESIPEDAPKPPVVQNESNLAVDSTKLSRGQLIFVATYSDVQWTKDRTELLGSNLSVRNTSRTFSIRLKYVDFYDDHGILHENYISSPIEIAPMGSEIYHIHQHDEKGGAGSNFLLEWESDEPVSPPYIENVSFRLAGAQSLAFTSPAVVLRDRGPELVSEKVAPEE